MADIHVTSTSEEGFVTRSRVGDFELTIDATDEEGPNPNATLVADYASCYIPAFRVGAQQRDYDDLGKIEIDAEADIEGDEDELVERGEDNCHVHAALRDPLHADIAVESGAF